jgi:hypothetical protein
MSLSRYFVESVLKIATEPAKIPWRLGGRLKFEVPRDLRGQVRQVEEFYEKVLEK